MDGKHIVIVGAGPAGLAASSVLPRLGYRVTMIDRSNTLGGHLSKWYQLFPDRAAATVLLEQLTDEVPDSVSTMLGREVTGGSVSSGAVELTLDHGEHLSANGLIMATGFDLFDARRKEEYGYGIYDNVFTQAEIEEMFRQGQIETRHHRKPRSIAFLHCVGSRDLKAGVAYCSKVCCVTGVKQAIELRELLPDAAIYNFYMDLRMFGRGFEELYQQAQERYNIRFVRGRISEAAESSDGSVIIKAEDTLTSRPLKLTVDMLVLLTGMQPAAGSLELAAKLGLVLGDDSFLKPYGLTQQTFKTSYPHVVLAGSCTGPTTLTEAILSGRSAAMALHESLFKLTN
ncbi:MAG: FAD-dependent oxidoreductase [Bacteroidales bacterium]|nr:FAD-dependent oxidoreductase [Bacteroidales bacterium]MDD3664784.1 FAD-dependent oxidoreductase [Bacteroidales bacterium]